MIQSVKVAKEIVVVSENRVGALSRAAQILSAAKINILAISAQATGGVGLINIVVDQTSRARSLLRKKGVATYEDEVILLAVEDQPGVLVKIAQKLAKGNIDILNVYGSAGSCCSCLLVLSVKDTAKAVALLKK